MVNACLVCRVGNGGRIKAEFSIINRPESRLFVTSLSNFVFFFLADNLSLFLICNSSIAPALRRCFPPGLRICRELLPKNRNVRQLFIYLKISFDSTSLTDTIIDYISEW